MNKVLFFWQKKQHGFISLINAIVIVTVYAIGEPIERGTLLEATIKDKK